MSHHLEADGLYHCEGTLPSWWPVFHINQIAMLQWTTHAIKAAETDRYGHFTLPSVVDLSDWHVIECERRAGRTVKMVLRSAHPWKNDDLDLVMVVRTGGLIVTAWLNHHADTHGTLDTSKYVNF